MAMLMTLFLMLLIGRVEWECGEWGVSVQIAKKHNIQIPGEVSRGSSNPMQPGSRWNTAVTGSLVPMQIRYQRTRVYAGTKPANSASISHLYSNTEPDPLCFP